MKFHLKNVWSILICLVFAGLVAAGIAISTQAEPAETVESVIQKTFEKLEITDAERVDGGSDGLEQDSILYRSSSTGFDYYFNPENGALIRFIFSDPTDHAPSVYQSNRTALCDEDRRMFVLEYITDCLPFELIGPLEIEAENFNGYTYHYTISEKYNNMETGTVITASCDPYGEIRYCNFWEGTIFHRNDDGTYSLAKGAEFIGETAATENAYKACGEYIAALSRNFELCEGEETVEMKARENTLYYAVTIYAAEKTANGDCPAEFYFDIDAYTGEVFHQSVTQ